MIRSSYSATISVLAILFALSAQGQYLTLDQKLSDFHQLNQSVESAYGPYQYKNEVMGFNLPQLKETYEQRIRQTTANRDFYYLLKQYIAEFHDGHFRAALPTTHEKSIPITTEWVNGRILVDTIDRTIVPVEKFPFERGSEIISVNGRPVAEVVHELKSYFGSGFSLSETRRGARLIFRRPGRSLPVPLEATITVEVLGLNQTKTTTVELNWIEKGQPLDEILLPAFAHSHLRSATNKNIKMLSTSGDWKELLGAKGMESSYQCSGTTRVAIPQGATMIFSEPFVAYYHPTTKGNIGYLRIPHYNWEDPNDPEFASKVFDQYQYAVSVLEKNTVGLIIDQDHNCGGSVDFLEAQVGLFVTTSYMPMQFKFRGTKGNFLEFSGYRDTFLIPNTIAYNQLSSVIELIKQAWLSGTGMTPFTGIDGEESFQPNVVHYTKPIVMTIDEMSGSGGDAFPALLQGYGRAKLVGTRTSGLGGHVTEIPPLNYTGLTVDMTKSQFYRPDGVAVENNGAQPDVSYVITKDDFLNGYRGYQKFYLNVLLNQLP